MEDDKVVFIISVEMISVMSSSLKELRLTLTSAMRERLTQTQIISLLTVGISGLEDIERIEAKCEVSGVTKIILKACHILLSE